MLILKNINLTLGKKSILERQILKNLNLAVANNEFVTVIGGNGAGKSTVLNAISGYFKPDSGRIILDGRDITNTKQASRSAFIAQVMQDPKIGTMENMTILENMAFALKRGQNRNLMPLSNNTRKKLFKEKLVTLGMGLENRLDELVSSLSGGQRQALSLIMAIIANSKLLLLDEITAALDPKIAETVMQIANKIIKKEKCACVMITHNMMHAIKYSDRIVVLKDGCVVKEYKNPSKQQLTPLDLTAEFDT